MLIRTIAEYIDYFGLRPLYFSFHSNTNSALAKLRIAKRGSMFTGCAMCKFLQRLLSNTARSEQALLQTVRNRLGRHYAFQAAQRLADDKLCEEARRSNNTIWNLDCACELKFLVTLSSTCCFDYPSPDI